MTRDTAVDFFRDKAFAYTNGQLRYVASLHKVPSVFRMGTNAITVESRSDIEHVYETYRSNLIRRNYSETKVEVVHVETGHDGRVRCLVQYRNIDKSGLAISEEFASYFLEEFGEVGLRIQMVEFVDEPDPELLAGWL